MDSNRSSMPPVVILCGGQGTRLREVSERIPKPMVPIGGQPILWHIMRSYAAFGVDRFILCLGYKREVIVDYFLNFHALATDITLNLGTPNEIEYHGETQECNWQVTLADTGESAMTGARVSRATKYLRPEDDRFFLTYGDGLADVDICKLLDFHVQAGRKATITTVQPSSRFGEVSLADDRVSAFQEKSPAAAGFVNGGFMTLERGFVESYLTSEESVVLEKEPLRSASEDGEVSAFVHEGYWQCMDTPREHELLNAAWASGEAPWTKHWGRKSTSRSVASESDEPLILSLPKRRAG